MASDQKIKKRKVINSNNFLEALRDLGGGIVDSAVHDVAGGVTESAIDQLTGRKKSGELKPDEVIELNKVAGEEIARERFTRDFEREILSIRRHDRMVYTREQQEIKLQIKAIQDELRKLVDSTKGLVKEIEIAAKQAPVEPGIYHLTFFEKLRQLIILFKKQIDESATWLAAFNRKAKRRSYYWAQVKKSGTKFLLSPDRYMATQAG